MYWGEKKKKVHKSVLCIAEFETEVRGGCVCACVRVCVRGGGRLSSVEKKKYFRGNIFLFEWEQNGQSGRSSGQTERTN